MTKKLTTSNVTSRLIVNYSIIEPDISYTDTPVLYNGYQDFYPIFVVSTSLKDAPPSFEIGYKIENVEGSDDFYTGIFTVSDKYLIKFNPRFLTNNIIYLQSNKTGIYKYAVIDKLIPVVSGMVVFGSYSSNMGNGEYVSLNNYTMKSVIILEGLDGEFGLYNAFPIFNIIDFSPGKKFTFGYRYELEAVSAGSGIRSSVGSLVYNLVINFFSTNDDRVVKDGEFDLSFDWSTANNVISSTNIKLADAVSVSTTPVEANLSLIGDYIPNDNCKYTMILVCCSRTQLFFPSSKPNDLEAYQVFLYSSQNATLLKPEYRGKLLTF